jgi:hypothetical protein
MKITESDDKAKLTARNHYVGIDAVAWYVNKESNWFKDRMASGTFEAKLSSGLENYDVALGTFELKDGSKIAPIFDRAVVPDRNYRGGNITLHAQLSAIKNDTAMAGILKSAANATLGLTAGMVSTASATSGPSKLLAAAGGEIISGVKNLLSGTAEKKETIFDFTGIEYTIRPDEIAGPEAYILFHRGAKLNENQLLIKKHGQLYLPFYNNILLNDGAWILIRIRRSDEYSGVREWYEAVKELRMRITSMVDAFFDGINDKDVAISDFQSTASGGKTTMDEYLRIRSIIENDGVISEREAGFHILNLRARMNAARQAISSDNRQLYDAEINKFNNAVATKSVPTSNLVNGYVEDMKNLISLRSDTIPGDTSYRRVASLSIEDLFSTTKYMTRLVSEYVNENQV